MDELQSTKGPIGHKDGLRGAIMYSISAKYCHMMSHRTQRATTLDHILCLRQQSFAMKREIKGGARGCSALLNLRVKECITAGL